MENKHPNYHAIIMAGGVGSRFWPLSRNQKPKQFLDILGTGKTLIQLTYERLIKIIHPENIWVVSHADYQDLIKEQLPLLQTNNILLEPQRKNTAPCILFAALEISRRDPNSILFIAPSDHLILNESMFVKDVSDSFDFISKNPENLLTFGIQASRPDTGYGYINFDSSQVLAEDIYQVHKFVEKPDHNTALSYLQSGNYVWNSGMFLWKTNTILHSLEIYAPDLFKAFNSYTNPSDIISIYQNCKSDSIDIAVMEKSKSVVVKTVDFGWSDLGTWGSLYELLPHDLNENASTNTKLLLSQTKSCMIHDEQQKLIALHGVEDLIIINTEDVLLICHKSEEQAIKQIVSKVQESFGPTLS
ncbi:MAG: mannose-1-phosphate guanylyltransferase [Saprospiraceae bacterium]|nr:mannose-1-phosphate guanylyltransferase [Saprospiraceae bacterium]